MRIHYLVSSLDSGGAEFVIPDLVRFFERHGHEVDLTACEPKDMGTAPRLAEANIPCHLLANPRRFFIPTLHGLLKHLRARRPDVIWTSLTRATALGQIAGRLLNIPVVSWKHSAAVRPSMLAMSRMSQLWIGDSPMLGSYLRTKMHLPADRVMTWPLLRCDMESSVPGYWQGQGVLRLGSVGRLHKVKNYDRLLKALVQFREHRPDLAARLHLSLAGDGPERDALEAQIRTLGLERNVTLVGALRHVGPFLESLHLYVQPSRYEGLCLAAHEAMAAGLPVMATPVGELQASLRDGRTGFVLKGDLETAICTTLEHLFAQPHLLASCGQAGQALARGNFSPAAFETHGRQVLTRVEEIARQARWKRPA
ncbi:glycosyltransferase [Oecophyllibacter saccharovorans]|uniref:glycosyltransferase n=1 Tax=Oecophyllibacter saccharovorans TaxID=2558360 RepID=UPI00117251B5|nr:glycosyltransferase [Oecophyllibacter saccharovorans]TPW33718.1 glycosyltransferase [Oecophyllibacter saccharovorans]